VPGPTEVATRDPETPWSTKGSSRRASDARRSACCRSLDCGRAEKRSSRSVSPYL